MRPDRSRAAPHRPGVTKVQSTSRVGCELDDAVARSALAQDTVVSVHLQHGRPRRS